MNPEFLTVFIKPIAVSYRVFWKVKSHDYSNWLKSDTAPQLLLALTRNEIREASVDSLR